MLEGSEACRLTPTWRRGVLWGKHHYPCASLRNVLLFNEDVVAEQMDTDLWFGEPTKIRLPFLDPMSHMNR